LTIDLSVSDISGAGYLVYTSNLDEEGSVGTRIVNEGAYAGALYIKDFSLTYDENKGVFHGSYIIVSSATDTTKTCDFSYRTIAD